MSCTSNISAFYQLKMIELAHQYFKPKLDLSKVVLGEVIFPEFHSCNPNVPRTPPPIQNNFAASTANISSLKELQNIANSFTKSKNLFSKLNDQSPENIKKLFADLTNRPQQETQTFFKKYFSQQTPDQIIKWIQNISSLAPEHIKTIIAMMVEKRQEQINRILLSFSAQTTEQFTKLFQVLSGESPAQITRFFDNIASQTPEEINRLLMSVSTQTTDEAIQLFDLFASQDPIEIKTFMKNMSTLSTEKYLPIIRFIANQTPDEASRVFSFLSSTNTKNIQSFFEQLGNSYSPESIQNALNQFSTPSLSMGLLTPGLTSGLTSGLSGLGNLIGGNNKKSNSRKRRRTRKQAKRRRTYKHSKHTYKRTRKHRHRRGSFLV